MKFLSIWQGFKLSAMTPWYHMAALTAGLCLDTSDVQTIYELDAYGEKGIELATADYIMS